VKNARNEFRIKLESRSEKRTATKKHLAKRLGAKQFFKSKKLFNGFALNGFAFLPEK
jgi:hypothetical protein